ncbi:threonine ammonia-lyase IlvA [Scopulibacillus cellulosilyticus]|uniref:L-threonine dehydratase n=1 Tax=Scopulibacillus cellulosilyticus TaxID=2665665 RepID=A0ABW2PTR5_9BACL
MTKLLSKIHIEDIMIANQTLKDVVVKTPLQRNDLLSKRYDCNVYLKREDLQVIRSFKIRGAYNMMKSLTPEELQKGVVCASAGNHAQGVAYSCKILGVYGKIFMPSTTPRQKVNQVKFFGEPFVQVILTGDTFDDSFKEAMKVCEEEKSTFIHPFDNYRTITGQGTVGVEIINDMEDSIDFVFVPIGGGGLASGVGSYMKSICPDTKVVGIEPTGAAGMKRSIGEDKVVELNKIDKFVDGCAVKKVGDLTFDVCRDVLDDVIVVPEGKVCTTILDLYNENAIIAEPSGALPIAALDYYKDEIKGKNVVCVVSGGNNDIDRMQEIKERSLMHEGLKHYFIVQFPQRAGALRSFITQVLGAEDDITHFEYTKKNDRDKGPVLVGIELKHKEDYAPLIQRMEENGFSYMEINKDQKLFNLLI